jgi:KUP system potassium uptake protein
MKLPRFRRPSGEVKPAHGSLALLAVGALGVVYGDIGTSPLYAVNFLFFSQTQIARSTDNICGGISLVVWALTLVIAAKYATFVLRADNDGEGGVFALYGLLDKFTRRGKPLLLWVLLLGAGLLLGDGMITPAISVLSAVEGVRVATPMFNNAVIPITLVILTALFALQFKGTGGVGRIFGPVMIVWFFVIAGLGLVQIVRQPEILRAFDPFLGLAFLARCGWRTGLLVLGAIVLVLTGGEAMYADLGHFGARPIRLSWFGLAYPCLLLDYLGQGAFLLGGTALAGHNLFYSMVPPGFIFPMVGLATAATIIASQALISGAFSLIAQAIALGLFPRLVIKHTHHAQAGEVYVPFVNRVLYVGCVLLVIGFRSSAALGAAYGLAESGVMIITSTAMFSVARRYWNWSLAQSGGLFGAVALIDGAFVVANSLKVLEGGWVPLSIGLLVFFTMATWRWGRKLTYAGYSAKHTMSMLELIALHQNAASYIERTAILMVPAPVHPGSERTPALMQLLWDRLGVLPRNLIFVQVVHPKVPYIHENRYSVTVFERSAKGSIIRVELKFGFMEEPNVEAVLEDMISHKEIDLPADERNWIVHVSHENLVPEKVMRPLRRIRLKFFNLLRFVSRPAYYHYGLGDEVQLSAEILPVHVR